MKRIKPIYKPYKSKSVCKLQTLDRKNQDSSISPYTNGLAHYFATHIYKHGPKKIDVCNIHHKEKAIISKGKTSS